MNDAELNFAAAMEEMRLALHVDDRPRAERAFRAIEQCRAAVRPALLPHGLKVQTALLLRRGEFEAALDRCTLMMAICGDHAVPERDRAGYIGQQAHALTGLRRFDEAVAVLQSLRPTQAGGQAEVLEVKAPERLGGLLLAARERCQAMLVAAVLQQVAALCVADQNQQHSHQRRPDHQQARALLARGLAALAGIGASSRST